MKLVKLALSIALPYTAGAIGGVVTTASIPTWYATLDKPWFNPPNWVFGPVWSVLYLLMGVSLYLVWVAKSKQSKKLAFVAFGTQLALNAMWSLVFFGAQQPWLAVGVIIVLLAAIIWTMHEFRKFSRMASWLLVPYIIWVAFASALNVAVAFLN